MTDYARFVFGPTWSSRIQTSIGLILFVVLVLIGLNDPAWGGPWESMK